MAIIEGKWILKNSIALIHHSEVVHIKDLKLSSKKTKQLAIFSLLGTSILIAIACLLPQSLYVFIFGKEFKEIKTIILLSSPGVLSISTTSVIAYFFSALGRVKFNTISSCIGLLVIMASSLMLISSLGINGAAIANALSFLATSTSLIYFYYTYTSKTKSTS